jgi:hypothetical protein
MRPPQIVNRRAPVIVTSATDIATTLRGDREALGMSGEELDAVIGWPDRYAAKVENPRKKWGRTLFRIEPMADYWLKGLNRSLVLMDRDQAEQLMRDHAEASQGPESKRLARVRVVRLAFG